MPLVSDVLPLPRHATSEAFVLRCDVTDTTGQSLLNSVSEWWMDYLVIVSELRLDFRVAARVPRALWPAAVPRSPELG